MPLSTFIPTAAAVIRVLEGAALALAGTDPMEAMRLAMVAAEMRDRSTRTLKPVKGGAI